jgi:hypothetical protein
MRNFWAYVALLVFGPMVVGGLLFVLYLMYTVLFGGAGCQPTTCQ